MVEPLTAPSVHLPIRAARYVLVPASDPMRAALLALALAVSACGADTDAPTAEPVSEAIPPATIEPPGDDTMEAADGASPRTALMAARPATATATVSVEGFDESIPLRLVRFENVPLPFSTYLPNAWSSDVAASGEGTAVRLTTGEPPFQGVVSVFVPSAGNDAAALARAVADSRGGAQPMDRLGWARSGYTFFGDGVTGTVRTGEHAGVGFYVVEEFPLEMGDGFAPRAALVLDRLRWLDDGTGL